MIPTTEQSAALIRWLEGLADPTRLRLLRLLERHELGVAELCDILQMPQSTVSRHLKLLADQGWLVSRRQGTNNLYRMILDELTEAPRNLWITARAQTEDWPTWQQDQLRAIQRLRAREQGSQGFFAGAAAEWDRLRVELYGHAFVPAAIASLLPPDMIVADLGCGTGTIAAALAPHVRQVIGIDNSPAMLDAARQRTADLANVELREGDIAAPPIAPGSCDAAMLILVLTYVDDVPATLGAARRLLRRGGRLVIVDLLRHDRDDFRRQMKQQGLGFEPDELAAALKASGFASATTQALAPEPNVKGPALVLATARRN